MKNFIKATLIAVLIAYTLTAFSHPMVPTTPDVPNINPPKCSACHD